MGRCSHCGFEGHNYVTCPQLSPLQIEEMKKKKKEEKEAAERRRIQRNERRIAAQQLYQQQQQQPNQVQDFPRQEHLPPAVTVFTYEILNTTDFELVCYCSFNDQTLKRFLYVGAHTNMTFTCGKSTQIDIYPSIELIIGTSTNAEKYITKENEYTKFFSNVMENYDGDKIIIDKKYNPPKTELEEWKEFGLKSHFLLRQIEKMTSEKKNGEVIVDKKYENIESFIEMVQDINTPNTCTDVDKERAGIPSALTNIT